MWLLDANMDVHLIDVLSEFGIGCHSAIHRGWGNLSNGQLISAAVEAGFRCLLTNDRLFAESAREALQLALQLSIVVVHVPQMPWPEYIQQFRAAWAKQPIVPVPGSVIHWPPDQ